MSDAAQSFRDLVLELVPADRTRVANQSLLADLQGCMAEINEAEYFEAKDGLVADALPAKRNGRGGSVYRPFGEAATDPAAAAKPAAQKIKTAPMPAGNGSVAYAQAEEAVQPLDVGSEAQFSHRKPAIAYRYDSSFAAERLRDESGERAFAERLLNLVAEAAKKRENTDFAELEVWKGTDKRFTSLSQCAVLLRSLTQPLLNWAGKAERQQINEIIDAANPWWLRATEIGRP